MAGSRDAVAAELTALSAPGQPMNTDIGHCTETMYAKSAARRRFLKRVVRQYLGLSSPLVGGRMAILTAGPPGAGKTTLLHTQVPNLTDYRILDADIVKDYLIQQALRDGIYDHLLNQQLADGHSVSPRELASLVHRESTRLIDQIRRICVRRRENIVVEGTLTWPLQGPQVFAQLATAGYTSVEVFGVETDRATARKQALSRWWDGRQRWISGTDPLGGRFMPPAFIDNCYLPTGKSVCSANALQVTVIAQQSGTIPNVEVRIFDRQPTGAFKQLSHTAYP